MKTKMIEIRDAGTCITAIAIKTESQDDKELAFFRRGGWGSNSIILIKTNGDTIATHDPFRWRDGYSRTMFEAHRYIEQNFDELPENAVIDVQYILNETDIEKESEIWR